MKNLVAASSGAKRDQLCLSVTAPFRNTETLGEYETFQAGYMRSPNSY